MNFKDSIISYVHKHKNGEATVKFKMKPEDFTEAEYKALWDLWNSDTAVDIEISDGVDSTPPTLNPITGEIT